MKSWVLWTGVIGAGVLALFVGFRWYSGNGQPRPVEALDDAALISDLKDWDLDEPSSSKRAKARLELRLPLYQPFPLLKTVEQVLIQKTPEGDRVSHSSLELAVTLRLEETAHDGSQLLSVVYDRVRYRQDVAGRTFVFDSTVPSEQLPMEALPYKGLVGNGFSFWIGKNHRILKPVGFAEFLKRCVREVPPSQQQRVLAAFSQAADEGVANFVDDSIGFLPPNPEVKEGETWNRKRRMSKPIPLVLSSRCTLNRLTELFAEIDIEGTIEPPNAFPPPSSGAGDVEVMVRGGRTKGRSEIDHKTGLPLHAEMKRSVDMDVRLADGRRFDQQKITTTTIRLLPQEPSKSPSGIVPVGAEIPARN